MKDSISPPAHEAAAPSPTSQQLNGEAAVYARRHRPLEPNALVLHPTPPHCATCGHYAAPDSECRRYAPALGGMAAVLKTKWPTVAATDWCGEHADA